MIRRRSPLLVASAVVSATWLLPFQTLASGPGIRDVCAVPDPRATRCYAVVQTGVVQLAATSAQFPSGFHPADLRSAYNLPSATAGHGQTVAIVDVYDDPNAESDLAVYRRQFGLPPCTTANGCFTKVNEFGQATPLPPANPAGGWQSEESLDLDMVSAICPNCHILLIEAFNPHQSPDDNANLAIGDNTAARLGATAVSNSFGTSNGEFPALLRLDQLLNHPGIAYTASSGDNGYRASWPASSQYVTAVGGTSLSRAAGTTRGWSETAWSGAGSFCSPIEPKPSWQHDPGCSMRTYADVSAVADPFTGVAVYDTFQSSGWQVFGGTSVASPIIASVYALAGNAAQTVYGSYPYLHPGGLYDITSGSNGSCGTYICNAGPGYDGPTGLGTPNGVGSF
jgi:subtilase family serine protease